MTTKAKVYKDIICLEVYSPEGARWWLQTPTLSYTPYHVDRIVRMASGVIRGSSRPVLAVQVRQGGEDVLVAVNIARSDIAALKRKRLVPASYTLPERVDTYTPWPTHAQKRLQEQAKKGTFTV